MNPFAYSVNVSFGQQIHPIPTRQMVAVPAATTILKTWHVQCRVMHCVPVTHTELSCVTLAIFSSRVIYGPLYIQRLTQLRAWLSTFGM